MPTNSKHFYYAPILFTLMLQGCMPSIWNAGDLAEWVRESAIERGCEYDSIKLEDWYRETPDGNVWYGKCVNSSGDNMSFGINVDAVWTPSEA